VHDSLLVRGGEPLRELPGVLDDAPRGERAGGEALAQGLSLEELGDGVGGGAVVTEVVDREDVRAAP
jgi:hypothetical protein